MLIKAKTAEEYLKKVPADRRKAMETVRKVILKNLPKGYEESATYGMLSYCVPLKVVPKTYNGLPLCYAGLASQKNYMSVYLMGIYSHKGTEKWFRDGFAAAGKKLDCGKCCVRFKKLEDLPLEVIGQAVAKFPMKKWVKVYEDSRKKMASRKK